MKLLNQGIHLIYQTRVIYGCDLFHTGEPH